ncbi:hypothetical protein U9M48_008381 [Paspalum notatum var. saurae]
MSRESLASSSNSSFRLPPGRGCPSLMGTRRKLLLSSGSRPAAARRSPGCRLRQPVQSNKINMSVHYMRGEQLRITVHKTPLPSTPDGYLIRPSSRKLAPRALFLKPPRFPAPENQDKGVTVEFYH